MNNDFEWLKNLKVGDEVAVDESSQWHGKRYVIRTVKNITPTGRIRLSDGTQYKSDGYKIGGGLSQPLRKITPQILDVIERRELLGKLKFDEFKGLLSAEKLIILLKWQNELLEGKGNG